MKHSKPVAIPNESARKSTKEQPDMQEQIRRRAYGLYEQRGNDGSELADWLQAEAEVTQGKRKTVFVG